jgi:4-hydroxybenzoate polyprenyltransferase
METSNAYLPRNGSWSKIGAYVELLHLPPIIAVLLAATAFAATAAEGWPPGTELTLLLISLLLTQIAISLHNDYCDRELDAATKPWRALPQGYMKPTSALGGAMVLAAIGVAVASAVSIGLAVLIATGVTAGFIYNAWLKSTALSWLPFWVGLPTLPLAAFEAVGRFDSQLWLAYVIGAPLVIAIYFTDTIIDLEADASHGVQGLAHRLRPEQAYLACWLAVLMAQALAVALWPGSDPPNALFYVSVGLLLAAVIATAFRYRAVHWPAIMGSAIALATGWLAAL